ncbi:hypothetical protein WJX77_002675 [Trebouxia sp. C0004]
MLRGQASLQELIGRSFMTRKRPPKSKKKAAAVASASTSHDLDAIQSVSAYAAAPKGRSLQPGHALCPVCGVPTPERMMNTHLDTCLAQETLQRSKGDAKQSTLQRFASTSGGIEVGPIPAAPRQLRRSATAATISTSATEKHKARRSSSDSAMLLRNDHQAELQHSGSEEGTEEMLPIRKLKQRSSPYSTPLQTVPSAVAAQRVSGTQQDLQSAAKDSALANAVHSQLPAGSDRCLHFQTSIVGRRFRTNITCTKHTQVALVRQAENPKDSNAIQVIDTARHAILGYLPREIAQHLAGLLDAGSIKVAAAVDEPKSIAAAVPILLEMSHAPGISSKGDVDQTLALLVKAAADWQASGLQRQGSNTGACLRSNFLLMADIVVNEDMHLLDDQETQLLTSFKALGDEAQCLFLRLFLRKGPWFRLNTLVYSELTDIPVSAQQLCQAGMATPLYCNSASSTSIAAKTGSLPETAAAAAGSPLSPGTSTSQAAVLSIGSDEQTMQGAPCSLVQAASCSVQLVLEVAEILTVAELQLLMSKLEVGTQGRTTGISKGQMLQLLKAGLEKVEGSAAEAPFKQEVLTSTGPCIKLELPMCSFINRVQRLFFLNEAQNLSSFLIADLGVAKYPSYAVTRSRSIFTTRQDLLDYEQALQHAAELDNALEDMDTDAADKALQPAFAAINADLHKQQPSACGGGCSATQMPFFLRYSSAWVYAAMATTGVSLMEKRKQWPQAVELLQQLLGGVCCLRRRGEWWTRLSVDLEHLGRPDESLEMAEAALADEWVINGDRVALQRRVLRLGKPPRRWKRPSWASVAMREPLEVQIEGQPLNSVLGVKSRFAGNGGDECSVEELALQYYAAETGGNWTGTHAEGGIWATLFGLLMWDIIFMDVPDVFQTAFQTAPLDLGTVVFYPSRKDAIEARLSQVREGQGPALLQSCWREHHGEWCRGVNWDRHGLDDLDSIAKCVGGQGLAAVCRLLAEDFSGWAGGMPDLLLWNVNTCKAKLSEVKGPRDRLSEQQRAWINALIDAEVDVEVLKVVEPRQGTAPKRRRKW